MAAIRNAPLPIRTFALQQTRTLLLRLAYQVSRASRPGAAEVLDDLRAAILRFSRCLRIFAQFLPGGKSKKVRQELKELMGLATVVRNCEVSLQLLREAQIPAGSSVSQTLSREHTEAETKLRAALRRLGRRSFSQKWRAGLRL